MSLDQAISPLVAIALIELMVATGLGIRLADVVDAARDWRLLARAGLVNYVAVPLVLEGEGNREEEGTFFNHGALWVCFSGTA